MPQMERNQVAIQNRTLAVLCTSSIASRGAVSALFTVAALSIEEMLDSSRWAGLSTVAITVGSMIAAAMLATMMDRSGRRPGITFGYAIAAVGSVVAIVGLERDSVVVFLVGLILVGICLAVPKTLQRAFFGKVELEQDLAHDRRTQVRVHIRDLACKSRFSADETIESEPDRRFLAGHEL